MKKNIHFFVVLLLLSSCKLSVNKEKSFSTSDISMENYESFGKKIAEDAIYYENSIADKYENLKEGDTITIAFSGKVNTVCKVKGCWMKISLGNNKQTMVRFKDYGFFVPKDIENDTVIVKGKAFVSEVSVEEQRHFASDAGKTEKEIASIIAPKRSYSFIADGVLIKK